MEVLPKRKHPRLKRYDYSLNERYFITICTHQKKRLLSVIKVGRGLAPAETLLTDIGKIVETELLALPLRYDDLLIEKYVIMPNHVHVILTLNASAGASPRPTLMDIVCTFKSLCTRRCKQMTAIDQLWQTSFYDHIIRDELDYKNIWNYIDNNPARWAEDKYFI
jgi:REP element-mobilizing transposase RayT